jgi:hypothetical protein
VRSCPEGEADANGNKLQFLAGHDIRLVTLGAQAERYFRDDPSTAIVKLRQYCPISTIKKR